MDVIELWIGFFVTLAVGVMCIVFGCMNRKGNLSMLHSYHYKRVSEEDRIPFGRMVGVGMILDGVSLFALGGLMVASELLASKALMIAGIAVSCCGLAAGLVVSFSAMIKYNKGIF